MGNQWICISSSRLLRRTVGMTQSPKTVYGIWHLMELHAEFEGSLSDCTDEELGDEMCQRSEFKTEYERQDGGVLFDAKGVKSRSGGAKKVQNGGFIDLNIPGFDLNELATTIELNELSPGNLCIKSEVNKMPILSDGGTKCANDDDILILDPSDVNEESFNRKRKRESMQGMLNWLTGIAKNPCDPVVDSMPEKSKWRSHSNEKVWKQVLLFREAVFLKRRVDSSSEQLNWQRQKMHPSMYEDHLEATYNLRERWKCAKKLIFEKSMSARVSSDSSMETKGNLEKTSSPHNEDSAEKELPDSSSAPSGIDKCGIVPIPLGPSHQAKVPEWTGMTSESDSKWLGTRIWPLEKVNHRLLIERDPIGRGRQDLCGCQVPGSVACVRFHVSEKRAKVKLELGVAFYLWNLHRVGEDVRQSWTVDEEKKFKDVVRSNPPSLERYYWDHIFKAFPKKTREDLVSYYFNVYLLQRRGYQNRSTPNEIDSDDEESEFGPLRNVFGQQAQKPASSILLTPKKSQTKNK
ncbi:AT-rich interactive domain-containing protein 1-like isoform X1 [Neltuma alba]|uniref:AT-rich interactive domain-containing protein 1-like isoform X1 n=2 Tax=Neltuma alba TaxID=207710 RepID=UPI0010A479FF|nr:AT-rich interactive domain-containing protein 1-like isoform X1 [Prosopis alba]